MEQTNVNKTNRKYDTRISWRKKNLSFFLMHEINEKYFLPEVKNSFMLVFLLRTDIIVVEYWFSTKRLRAKRKVIHAFKSDFILSSSYTYFTYVILQFQWLVNNSFSLELLRFKHLTLNFLYLIVDAFFFLLNFQCISIHNRWSLMINIRADF